MFFLLLFGTVDQEVVPDSASSLSYCTVGMSQGLGSHFLWQSWHLHDSFLLRQNSTLNQVKGKQHDSLLLGETSEVPPVAWKVLKLVGVDGDEHQHGVGHHQPPEELEQTPPQRVVHLGHSGHKQPSGKNQQHKTSTAFISCRRLLRYHCFNVVFPATF